MSPFLVATLFFLPTRFLFADDNLRKCDINGLEGSCNEHEFKPMLAGLQNVVETIYGLEAYNSIPLEVNYKNNSATPLPLCPPYDSCVNRCGSVRNGYTHTCNCDEQCYNFGDCCGDYHKECVVAHAQGLQYASYKTKPKCEIFLETFPIFMISKCSKTWNDTSVRHQCDNDLPIKCKTGDCVSMYYNLCSKRLSAFCSVKVDARCPELVSNQCLKIATSLCTKCNLKYWPVVGIDQVIYKNSYCAICNYQKNFTTSNLTEFIDEIKIQNKNRKYPIRKCFNKIIDSCDDNSIIAQLCSNYTDPVCGPNINGKRKFYKNIYCAYCHNETIEKMRCASPYLIDTASIGNKEEKGRPNILTRITKEGDGIKSDDLPTSFSMLLNFGLDGRQKLYISSENREKKRCEIAQIWDPISKVCRKLHCSTEFVLVDYKCVRKEPDSNDASDQNDMVPVPDPDSQFVHLTLSAQIELIDFLHFHHQDLDGISESIRESLSLSFNISSDRIRNIRLNISVGEGDTKEEIIRYLDEIDDVSHPINFTVDFDLYESLEHEPSVDSIVKILGSAAEISNGFEFGVKNVTGRITYILESVDFLKWCNESDGYKKKTYWNSDFTLILDDNDTMSGGNKVKELYVNKTRKYHPVGSFVSNILYKSDERNPNLVDVSSLAIVCIRKKKLNSSCARITLEKHEYEILNDTLVIKNGSSGEEVIDNTDFEDGDNDTVLVCLSRLPGAFEFKFSKQDIMEAFLSYILSWTSIAAMIIVLATYSFFSSLRNLPGYNTMNLTGSLLAMQITYVFGERNSVTGKTCKAVAIILHYEILCCFMWMNTMAYDLFKTFGAKTILNNIRSIRKYLPRYILYAYGIPALIVLATSLLDNFLEQSEFSPHYGYNDICWITSKTAAVAYFAVPLAVVMFVNFILFVLTILSIRNVKHVINISQQRNKQAGKRYVFLYARMAFVIGLTWALAFAAAYVREERVTGKILTYLFIIFNTLQGLFIFFVFVCNKRVYALYCGSFRKIFRFLTSDRSSGKTSKTFTNIVNVIRRSVSTDTVISTVSNSSKISNDSGLGIIDEIK